MGVRVDGRGHDPRCRRHEPRQAPGNRGGRTRRVRTARVSRVSDRRDRGRGRVSTRTLYNHFGDKLALFSDVLVCGATEVADVFERQVATGFDESRLPRALAPRPRRRDRRAPRPLPGPFRARRAVGGRARPVPRGTDRVVAARGATPGAGPARGSPDQACDVAGVPLVDPAAAARHLVALVTSTLHTDPEGGRSAHRRRGRRGLSRCSRAATAWRRRAPARPAVPRAHGRRRDLAHRAALGGNVPCFEPRLGERLEAQTRALERGQVVGMGGAVLTDEPAPTRARPGTVPATPELPGTDAGPRGSRDRLARARAPAPQPRPAGARRGPARARTPPRRSSRRRTGSRAGRPRQTASCGTLARAIASISGVRSKPSTSCPRRASSAAWRPVPHAASSARAAGTSPSIDHTAGCSSATIGLPGSS